MGACLHAKQFEMVQQYLTRWADSRNVETGGTAKYQSDLIGNNVSIYLFLFLISELSRSEVKLKVAICCFIVLSTTRLFQSRKITTIRLFYY